MLKPSGAALLLAYALSITAAPALTLQTVVTEVDKNAEGSTTCQFAVTTDQGETLTMGGHVDRGSLRMHVGQHPDMTGLKGPDMPTNEESDVSQVSPLLKQVPGLLVLATADGAYDGEPACRALAERKPHPRDSVVIPPRSSAVPSLGASTAPGQRDKHIRMI